MSAPWQVVSPSSQPVWGSVQVHSASTHPRLSAPFSAHTVLQASVIHAPAWQVATPSAPSQRRTPSSQGTSGTSGSTPGSEAPGSPGGRSSPPSSVTSGKSSSTPASVPPPAPLPPPHAPSIAPSTSIAAHRRVMAR